MTLDSTVGFKAKALIDSRLRVIVRITPINAVGFTDFQWEISHGCVVAFPDKWSLAQLLTSGQCTFPDRSSLEMHIGDLSLANLAALGFTTSRDRAQRPVQAALGVGHASGWCGLNLTGPAFSRLSPARLPLLPFSLLPPGS
jgi:hypothetical protein